MNPPDLTFSIDWFEMLFFDELFAFYSFMFKIAYATILLLPFRTILALRSSFDSAAETFIILKIIFNSSSLAFSVKGVCFKY